MKYEDLILISDPDTVYTKFKKIYPSDFEIKISTRNKHKYMIYDPNIEKWFCFGSTMEDYTRYGDSKRQINKQ